jgi:hypothetical protein
MENRMDESNSTTPRPVPEPVSLSVSAAVALTIGQPFVQDGAANHFAVPKKTGLSPRKTRLVVIDIFRRRVRLKHPDCNGPNARDQALHRISL